MATDFSNAWSCVLDGGADTIVARATPTGRGALAVLRVSGPGVRSAAARVCPKLNCDRPWRVQLVELHDSAQEPLDRVVAIPYSAPRSYTGEDMVEMVLHGSRYLVETAIAAWCAAGARSANAGEFTRRAVANGKMDLVQAEAVADLIAAETAEQALNAQRQLVGDLSSRFSQVHEGMMDLLARVEASLDFAHQDVAVDEDDLRKRRQACVGELKVLIATASGGRLVRDGVRMVIVGVPNAGKSTLFNHLLGRERAIVTAEAGTTRDVLEGEIEIGGMPVVLVDTAGMREGGGLIEAEGVRRARAALGSADAVLLLRPADGESNGGEIEGYHELPILRIRSKVDLSGSVKAVAGWYPLSFVSGEGVEGIRAEILRLMNDEIVDLGGRVAINRRHEVRLRAALSELEVADVGVPELAAEHLRWALEAVGEVLGFEISEQVLDRVFGAFCIGK